MAGNVCYGSLRMARKRIGELLVERALINAAQLEEGLAHHRQTRVRLGVALIQKGFITEDQLANALAANAGTFIGAICFFVAAWLVWPEAAKLAEEERQSEVSTPLQSTGP